MSSPNLLATAQLANVVVRIEWQQARQRNAAERGYAVVATVSAADVPTQLDVSDTDCLRCDPELARIAVGVKHAYLFQRWLVLAELNRTTGKQGYTRAEFDTALRQYGVKGCDAYNARLLRRGHGFYWTLHNDMVYPSSYVSVAKELIKHAARHGLHDLYATNAPGSMRPMYIRVSGTAADFEAVTLNAWYAARNNPTISRMAICALFNRSEGTLRQLERRAGIQITTNMVETTDSSAVPLKPDGSLRSDVYRTIENGRTVYHYRLANTYTSTRCKQHCHRGQSRKVSYLFKQWIESDLLASITGQGSRNASGKLNRSGRFYCETEKRAERSRTYGNTNTLVIPHRPGEGRAVIWCVYQ